ncbi:MAG: helix-turn-helix domain-containing protein [Planctomycetaceae bacterium]|nr:helix-turn-helix domain-containing protein [Planctomycetaceae bacterium]
MTADPWGGDDDMREELSERTLLTIQDVAEMLQVSTRSVRRLRVAGTIPVPLLIGKSVRWRGEEIRQWIDAGCLPVQTAARST